MNAVLVDAYDSFVYIIDQYLMKLGVRTTVLRCDDVGLDAALDGDIDFVVLGPGPGRPEDARYPQLLSRLMGRTPVLGVCLGHQAIALAFGGTVERAAVCIHGKTSMVLNDGQGVYAHTGGRPFPATRYHSLVVRSDRLSDDLVITSRARDDGHVMGLRHRHMPIEGVQFHPESVCTEDGESIFASFVDSHVLAPRRGMTIRNMDWSGMREARA